MNGTVIHIYSCLHSFIYNISHTHYNFECELNILMFLKYLFTFCILNIKIRYTYHNIKCGQHKYKSRTSLKDYFYLVRYQNIRNDYDKS